MLLLQHQGMLRTAELLGGIKVQDIKVGKDARTGKAFMTVAIHNSKMNKTGPPETIVLGESADKDVCAVSWMRLLLETRKLDPARDEHQRERVFVRWWSETGKTVRAKMDWSRRLWVKELRGLVAMGSGLNPKHVAGHSPRAGGATDALHSGETPHLVMLQGRWKQQSSLLLYDRWTVEERARAASRWVESALREG